MTLQHIPGPWFVNGDCAPIMVHAVVGSDESLLVATLDFDEDTAETQAANARLIAAAPDLLVALRKLLDWGRTHTGPEEENSPHALLIEAHNAISKATEG